MNNVVKYQVALDKVAEVSPLLRGEFQEELQKRSKEFMDEVQESQYIKVPLVGVFSAGKSSLLNVFTQRSGMLPVDTMPETAVAYELYYALTESVELFREGKKIDSKPLSDIKLLETQPGDIVKVYCTSAPIKQLQEKGIILVDMPGIGSGIERHDAAIFNYIKSGTAFVLIADAEQGSLRGSTLAFMKELSRYEMFPAVLVSKIDKKPEGDVKEIVEYIRYQMERLGNNNPFVGTVCAVNNNLDDFNRYLESLNPDALVKEKLGGSLKLIINSVISQLKTRIDIRRKDISDIEGKMKQLDEEIANVKAELPANEGSVETPEKSTQDVIDNVRAALEANAGDVAQMIINREDEEEIKAFIISIVRAEIISSLKEESEQYSTALGTAVQESIASIAAIEIDTDFMKNFEDILNIIDSLIVLLPSGSIWSKLAKKILPFLPKVLNWLFGKTDIEVLDEVRQEVLKICVNQITEEIKPVILEITRKNHNRIQVRIQNELISKMEKVREGLREKMADANKSKEEVESEISKLSAGIDKLKAILAEV